MSATATSQDATVLSITTGFHHEREGIYLIRQRRRKGTVIAAINVGTQSARISIKELTLRVLPELKATAADLTHAT
jgi:hypothetical protein